MINQFLEKLKPDFSNIDEVYNQLLISYNHDNNNTSELVFIDSISFNNLLHTENVPKLSMYLGKKVSKIDWQNIDYLYHYQKTKRFDFQSVIKPFSKNEFKEVKNRLEKYLLRYQFIFENVEPENKIEFKHDVLDHLKNISDKQHLSKYKTLLNEAIELIDADFEYKSNEPQQTETNILIKLEKEIETISKQMSIFKSIESKEINVCVISKTEIFDVNLLDNYLLNQSKNQYLDARLTDLKNLFEKVKNSNENKIDASNKETLYKYEFKRTNKKTNDPECYKFSSFNESIFLLNTAELKYKKIDFNEAENHYKNGYFAKSFTKGLLALKCNEILEVLNKYLTQQPKAKEKKILEQKLNYNSSQFNKYTFDLFCYILGEYKKEGNIKYINIWYFLKRDIKNKDKILFNFTQKEYKEYVIKYNIEIKKFQKAEFKYEDDEKRILQNIVDTYTQNLI